MQLPRLITTADQFHVTLGEAAELAAPLRALGLAVELPAELRDWRPDPRAARLLSRDLSGTGPFLEGLELQGRLHPLALAATAFALGATVDAFAPVSTAAEFSASGAA